MLVAALISAAIEIQLNFLCDRASQAHWHTEKCDLPILDELAQCNKVWDSFVADVFGKKSREDIDMLGRYLVLRLQAIFQAFQVKRQVHQLDSIFKGRCRIRYTHKYFAGYAKKSSKFRSPSPIKKIDLMKQTMTDKMRAILKRSNSPDSDILESLEQRRCLEPDQLKPFFRKSLQWAHSISQVAALN